MHTPPYAPDAMARVQVAQAAIGAGGGGACSLWCGLGGGGGRGSKEEEGRGGFGFCGVTGAVQVREGERGQVRCVGVCCVEGVEVREAGIAGTGSGCRVQVLLAQVQGVGLRYCWHGFRV